MVKVNKSASKKPAPKVGGKAKVAAKAKAPAKAKVEFEVGQVVQFVEYGDTTPEDDQVFEAGDRIVIKAIEPTTGEDGKTTNVYTAVKQEHSEMYDADADDEEVVGGEVLASEIKKVSAKAVKAEPEPIKVVAVGNLTKMLKGKVATEVAKGLLETARESFFYFGGVLAKIYNENLDAADGTKWLTDREAWEAYTEENFGMKPGQVRAYVDIYVTLSGIDGIDVKRIQEMGWSKAAEISKYITSENAEEVITLAEAKPINELKTELKDTYVDAEGKTPQGRQTRSSNKIAKTAFTFALFEDQAATVKYVLEAAQKTLGTETPEATFEYIVNEWASDHLDSKKVAAAKSAGNKAKSDLKKRGVDLPGTEAKTTKAKAKTAA